MKLNEADRPVNFCGKITYEFFNNDDEALKIRSLKGLCKTMRKDFNISCLPVEENILTNPERGFLVFSFCASGKEQGKIQLDKILAALENIPARIIADQIDSADLF